LHGENVALSSIASQDYFVLGSLYRSKPQAHREASSVEIVDAIELPLAQRIQKISTPQISDPRSLKMRTHVEDPIRRQSRVTSLTKKAKLFQIKGIDVKEKTSYGTLAAKVATQNEKKNR
jgi:hypothetical protein